MQLKVGFARYNITPPLGCPMAGYAQREGTARDVHDELTARAVAFEAAGGAAALILADVCSLPTGLIRRVKKRVAERTGLPARNVAVAAVHTHSGPALHERSAYRTVLPSLLASAAELAWARRRPARLFYASGQAPGLCVNRRRPDGPVDEQFDLLAAQGPDGRPFGVLFSYPLHGVVMGHNNLSISADYIGVARRTIEAALPGVEAVFAAGASGEMNPLTPSVEALLERHGESWFTNDPLTGIYDRSTGTFEEVELIGSKLGQAILDALPGRSPVAGEGVRSKAWRMDLGTGSPLVARIQAIALGQAIILALPGEHFVETGVELRRAARAEGRQLITVTHAGHLCYVPTPQAFAEGGYEVQIARRRGLAEDAQRRLVECVKRGIRSL